MTGLSFWLFVWAFGSTKSWAFSVAALSGFSAVLRLASLMTDSAGITNKYLSISSAAVALIAAVAAAIGAKLFLH